MHARQIYRPILDNFLSIGIKIILKQCSLKLLYSEQHCLSYTTANSNQVMLISFQKNCSMYRTRPFLSNPVFIFALSFLHQTPSVLVNWNHNKKGCVPKLTIVIFTNHYKNYLGPQHTAYVTTQLKRNTKLMCVCPPRATQQWACTNTQCVFCYTVHQFSPCLNVVY